MALFRNTGLLALKRARSVPAVCYHQNVRNDRDLSKKFDILIYHYYHCRYLTTTKIHGTLAHWIRKIKMWALAWLVLQPVVMSWNYRSKWMRMAKSSMPNSKRSVACQLSRPAHWPPNGWKARHSTRLVNWRTQTSLRNSPCHQSNYIVRVSSIFNSV